LTLLRPATQNRIIGRGGPLSGHSGRDGHPSHVAFDRMIAVQTRPERGCLAARRAARSRAFAGLSL